MSLPGDRTGPASFAGSSIQTIAVRGTLLIAGVGVGVILARWLGPEGVGVYALLLLAKNMAFRIGNLGIGTAFSYFVARGKVSSRRLLPLSIVTGLVLSALSVLVLLAVWRMEWSPWATIKPAWFLLVLPAVPMLFLTTFFERLLVGELRITAVNASGLVGDFSQFPLLALFVILLGWEVTGAVVALVLGDVARLSVLAWCLLRRPGGNAPAGELENAPARKLLAELVRFGRWQYLIMFFTFLVEDLPLMLLKSLTANDALAGFYTRARALGRQTRLMAVPISTVLFPFTAASEEKVAVNRTNILCRNLLLIGIVGVGLSCLVAEPVIVFLYGREFLPSVGVFYALAPGVVFWPIGHFLVTHLSASGRPEQVVYASVPVLLLGGAACWFLTRRFGMMGAAWGASLFFLFYALAGLVQYRLCCGAEWRDVLIVKRKDLRSYARLPGLIGGRLKGTKPA